MEKFKAVSGREVKPQEDGSVLFGLGLGFLSREAVFDAEEYFQARQDERLGRWRDPVMPTYVVYPMSDDRVRVFREAQGTFEDFSRADAELPSSWNPRRVAYHYFEARPVSKPWKDAKPGEVWVLTLPEEGDVDAEIVTVATAYGTFIADSRREWTLNDAAILAARRVLTEVGS